MWRQRRRPTWADHGRSRRGLDLAAADLTGVKSYLTEHTDQLVDFTGASDPSQDYDTLAADVDYDHARLLSEHGMRSYRCRQAAKDLWTEGNPYYERMEGIVAGTPSLAEYDIIIDGFEQAEDPESAVPSTWSSPTDGCSSSRATSTT